MKNDVSLLQLSCFGAKDMLEQEEQTVKERQTQIQDLSATQVTRKSMKKL